MTEVRAEILKVLAELSERYPEFRFGQMVVGLSWAARDFNNEAIFDVEDEEFLGAAQDLLTRRLGRTEDKLDTVGGDLSNPRTSDPLPSPHLPSTNP